ncbi:putative quinol monooxygenase [Flavobacterium faecale]|uniref:putative quinol monooxygenase n=1 Tax=Flavobacterium faecale TaxID=1355330 RepID=UPI003AAD2EA0
MSQITVVAKIVAKEEKREFVKAELLKLVQATIKEEGCINYDLHQDNEDANVFLMYENWKDADALAIHAASAHYVAFQTVAKGTIAEFEVNKLTLVG